MAPAAAKDKATSWAYPQTRRTDDADTLHGQRIPDPYRWLEDDDAGEVVAWDRAQTKVLRAHLDAYPKRQEVATRIQRELAVPGMPSKPRFEAGKRWFTRRPQGANHAVVYVTSLDKAKGANDDVTTVLDPNTWSEDGTVGLVDWAPSPNGRYVAFRRDVKGSEKTTLYVRDLTTGKDLAPDVITRTNFSPMVWSPDSAGFYYIRNPAPGSVPKGEEQYHRKVYYHALGADPDEDLLVYGEDRPMLEAKWIARSTDRKTILLFRGPPWRELDSFFLRRTGDEIMWVPLVVGDQKRTYVDRVGDTWLFNTDRNTGRREVFTAKALADGTPGTWKPFEVPRSDTAVLDDVVVADTTAVVLLRENVISKLWVRPLDGRREAKALPLPGPGTASDMVTRPNDSRVWFRFQSYARPPTNYVVDLAKEPWSLQVVDTLPTTIDVDALVSEQLAYPSKDGTSIPLFILRHKDTKLGAAPTVLYGYGGFRVGLYPRFSRERALWAEQGGVFAIANLRGGDEFGEAWHAAGCMANKQTVFDDFIAAADWLVKTRRASRDRLAIYGGSNGGLLVATCINQRPDLCAGVVCAVPLTDMLRYHRFDFAKSWTKEYGDPDLAEEFAWIRPYSPYHNVKKGAAYPAVLVEAGLEDGRVHPFHARKIVAQWQWATSGTQPILLNLDRESGHGAASLKQYRDEITDRFCFLLRTLNRE